MAARFSGYARADVAVNTDLGTSCASLEKADKVFLDTETMGFTGLCFLIQFSTNQDPKNVHLIRVLRESPAAVCDLLELLATKCLVIHNAGFDLFHLAKLYTVSRLVSAYTFDEVWRAESIFRAKEVSYEDRLAIAYGFYPAAVVDTMVVAQHSLPLANEFLGKGSLKLYKFPYACIDALRSAFTSSVAWTHLLKVYGVEDQAIEHLGIHNRISVQVEHANTKLARAKLADNPEKYLVTVKINYTAQGVFKLKNLAKYYGYCESEAITDFEFLDSFVEGTKLAKTTKKGQAPTVFDRDLYEKLFSFCRAGYTDTRFLDYAVRDVLLVHFVHESQPHSDGFSEALGADLALIPHYANLRLYGVKVDRLACDQSRAELSGELNKEIIELARYGLERPTSSGHCLPWLRSVTAEALNLSESEARLAVPSTDKKVVRKLAARTKSSEKIRAFVDFKQLEGVLKFLPRDTDSLYPEYNLYGTVTHRMTANRPNPQQIPKDERARRAFVGPAGYDMVVGDFDQLELRIMTYRFRVKVLLESFETGGDPHSQMGASMLHDQVGKLLGRPIDAGGAYQAIQGAKAKKEKKKPLTPDEKETLKFRGIGKTMNFGIIYGMKPYGLAEQLSCGLDDAKSYIDHYFAAAPEIAAAMEKSNAAVTRLHLTKIASYSRVYWKWDCQREPILPVVTRFGVSRGFAVPHSVMRLMSKVKERDYKSKFLKGVSKSHLEKYDESLRSAIKRTQGEIQRKAFNFAIQSTGAFLTKTLQRDICDSFIPRGKISRLADLDLLPTLNVHDELHFYVKKVSGSARLDEQTRASLSEVSDLVVGEITLKFDKVCSWADKA